MKKTHQSKNFLLLSSILGFLVLFLVGFPAKIEAFTEVSVQGVHSALLVRNYTAASSSIVNQIARTAENSIISHPSQPLEHFGRHDLLILTKHYFTWIKNTVTTVRQVNKTGSGGGMMKGFWTINGNNSNPNFKFGDRVAGVVNELGRSGYRESDGCVLAVQIGSGEDTGNAYFANFSTNGAPLSGNYFPQKNMPTGIGTADIYWFSGTMRNALLNKETINGNKINYIISYRINNEYPLIEVNPVLEAMGPINEVAVIWNSCEVNDYFTPLKYLAHKANAYYRFTWGTPDERSVYLTNSSVTQIDRIKEPSDVYQSNPRDGNFRDLLGFSHIYKTERGRTTIPPAYYRPLDEGKMFTKAGDMRWEIKDLLNDGRYSSLAFANNRSFNNRHLIFRVSNDTNGFDKEGLNNVQFMSATFTDFFTPSSTSFTRPPAPNSFNSLEQDPSVISLEACLFHKNAFVKDVANGIITPFIDTDGNQITRYGNKNFSKGRIWNFVYQFGHYPQLSQLVITPTFTPTPRPTSTPRPTAINTPRPTNTSTPIRFCSSCSPGDADCDGKVDLIDCNFKG